MQRILIANRGEIACRIIRACQRLNIETVAVYSEADSASLHATMADTSVLIGPPSAKHSYLNIDRLLEVASEHRVDGVHPGYGFLSENAEFARRVQDAAMVWIGPKPIDIENMGDKERARNIAQQIGMRILPGSVRFGAERQDLAGMALRVGYPLLIKATSGGGGMGMRRIDRPEDLQAGVAAVQQLAAKLFGDSTVFLERYVPHARHIEIQIFGYGDGDVVHLFERECSIQRRFQKVIEESPAPGLPDLVRARMAKDAMALAAHQHYCGPGTIEFVVDAATFDFYFLEMNTRIQVEHPVTEMITGWDLVGEQIKVAFGDAKKVAQCDIHANGAALECRIYAEDPVRNFLPSSGRLERFDLPDVSPALRVETGVRQGDVVTPYYDPMLAKLIVGGGDRNDVLEKMVSALTKCRVSGVRHNLEFLKAVLSHPRFVKGSIDTGFIDTEKASLLSGLNS